MINHFDIIKETSSREFLANEISKYGDISPEVMQKFLNDFNFVQYKKNHQIIIESESSEYLYFITKGIVMVYYHKDGNEIIDWFAEEGTFFGNLYDFIQNTRNTDIYESIEGVNILRIKYSDLNKWFLESHEIQSIALKILEQHYARYIERGHNLKSLQAEVKYCLFVKHCSSFINRIPLKYIANYLSITSETLSRIRSKHNIREC